MILYHYTYSYETQDIQSNLFHICFCDKLLNDNLKALDFKLIILCIWRLIIMRLVTYNNCVFGVTVLRWKYSIMLYKKTQALRRPMQK